MIGRLFVAYYNMLDLSVHHIGVGFLRGLVWVASDRCLDFDYVVIRDGVGGF